MCMFGWDQTRPYHHRRRSVLILQGLAPLASWASAGPRSPSRSPEATAAEEALPGPGRAPTAAPLLPWELALGKTRPLPGSTPSFRGAPWLVTTSRLGWPARCPERQRDFLSQGHVAGQAWMGLVPSPGPRHIPVCHCGHGSSLEGRFVCLEPHACAPRSPPPPAASSLKPPGALSWLQVVALCWGPAHLTRGSWRPTQGSWRDESGFGDTRQVPMCPQRGNEWYGSQPLQPAPSCRARLSRPGDASSTLRPQTDGSCAYRD